MRKSERARAAVVPGKTSVTVEDLMYRVAKRILCQNSLYRVLFEGIIRGYYSSLDL